MAQKKSGMTAKEEPMKMDDHASDCIRYLVMEIDGGGFILV